MECPYCNATLNYDDWYYTGNYESGQYQKKGDIYRCPNHEGFESFEDVLEYLQISEEELEEYLIENGYNTWDEVSCESAVHNVSGSFYADSGGDLSQGYPC